MTQKPEHLGGDRWRVRRYIGTNPETHQQIQRTKSFRASGPREAAKIASRILTELDGELKEMKADKGTVHELTVAYELHKLRVADWSPTHAKRQREILTVIDGDLGRIRLADLTARRVDQWFGQLMDRSLSPATVAHYHETLRAMLRQGDRWDMCTARAAEKATLPRAVRPEVVPPTNAVVHLLLTNSKGALRAALYIAALTGCRRGEILGLRWGDFTGNVMTVHRSVLDMPDGQVLVKLPKSRKSRRYTVDPGLLSELVAWRTLQNAQFARLRVAVPADCFIFADMREDASGQTPRRPGWLSLSWSRHRALFKAQSVRLHDLRHWHLSTLAAAGVPMTTIQARGGHADISTTGIYSHALPEGEEKTRGVITKALASGKPKKAKG